MREPRFRPAGSLITDIINADWFSICLQPARWNHGVEMLITGDNKVAVGFQWEEIKPNEVLRPTIRLQDQDAQDLMDDLWQCGIRPTEGTGSAGSLAATEGHLQDMRKIVAKKLGVEL